MTSEGTGMAVAALAEATAHLSADDAVGRRKEIEITSADQRVASFAMGRRRIVILGRRISLCVYSL